MGIIFALLSSIAAAFSYTSAKKSYEDFPPSVAFFMQVIFGLLIYLPFSFFVGIQTTSLFTVFLYAIISAILTEAFYFYILSKGQLSITGTLIGTYPLFVIFFSHFVNHEMLSLYEWFFIFFTIIGVLLISIPNQLKIKEIKNKSYILWALAGAIAVGISDSLTKHIISETSAGTFVFALAIAQIPVGIMYLKLEKQSLKQFLFLIKKFKTYQFSMYGGLLNVINVLFLFLAFQFTLASIASPIGASYPSIMIILAVVFLKEKIHKKDLLGLLITFIGVFGLSYLVR